MYVNIFQFFKNTKKQCLPSTSLFFLLMHQNWDLVEVNQIQLCGAEPTASLGHQTAWTFAWFRTKFSTLLSVKDKIHILILVHKDLWILVIDILFPPLALFEPTDTFLKLPHTSLLCAFGYFVLGVSTSPLHLSRLPYPLRSNSHFISFS